MDFRQIDRDLQVEFATQKMNEEKTNIIDMTDTDGNIVQFEHLLLFQRA